MGIHEDNNVKNIRSQSDYPDEFKSGNITAAFLELPYEKVFIKQYCHKYTVTLPTYRFGGLGFVFQKGSPIAPDFSEAILILSEKGKLHELEEDWFSLSTECSSSSTDQTESLSLQNFWGLYLISGATSTICFVLFLIHLYKNYRSQEEENGGDATPSDQSVWDRTRRMVQYFDKGGIKIVPIRSSSLTFAQPPDMDEWITPTWERVSTSESTPDPHHQTSSPPGEIEMA